MHLDKEGKKIETLLQKLEMEEESSQRDPNSERSRWKIKRLQHQIKIAQTEEMERCLKIA